jgi:hypothetical protein
MFLAAALILDGRVAWTSPVGAIEAELRRHWWRSAWLTIRQTSFAGDGGHGSGGLITRQQATDPVFLAQEFAGAVATVLTNEDAEAEGR